ncbi:hypothetical protein [Nitrosovibrio sp. Nv17]|uniref:hypothetical protein n=1 Tax=Nitrosovibrio sp. Nv17 TaxID=1855339 RepID=UPI00093205B3|nr:hypothetical protein [Nitrosovibrio sp. Nv17]
MKHAKAGSDAEGDALESPAHIPEPSSEELRRSHDIIQALMSTLPAAEKTELMNLLQTLAAGEGSRTQMNVARQRALKIVSDACKPAFPHEKDVGMPPADTAGGKGRVSRTGERRRGDRRRK